MGLKSLSPTTIGFVLIELITYGVILTASGTTLAICSFASIVLCFAYAALHVRLGDHFIIGGLLFTVCADFCLVICSPIRRLEGMIFFLIAQTLYAISLQSVRRRRVVWWIRLGLIAVVEGITIAVLRDALDALAVISVCYYVNLIVNLVESYTQRRSRKLLPLAFFLFLLCDTVVGLQVAADGYLPIGEESMLHAILFSGFNLAWAFYLPSQVLLAITSRNKRKS